jgi:hypothetical protein
MPDKALGPGMTLRADPGEAPDCRPRAIWLRSSSSDELMLGLGMLFFPGWRLI